MLCGEDEMIILSVACVCNNGEIAAGTVFVKSVEPTANMTGVVALLDCAAC